MFDVVIAGAGPVGLSLALDLQWRGLTALVVDPQPGPAGYPRCNNVAARTMEHFRRLGFADEVRRAGLPPDHPTDVVYRARYGGPEYFRFPYPSSREVLEGRWRSEVWPTPEPNHKVNQLHFEPILDRRARDLPGIDLRRGIRLDGYEPADDHVAVDLVVESTGERLVERGRYLVGCDGGSSTVRRAMGIPLVGDTAANLHSCSFYLRSPDLAACSPDRVWMAIIRNWQGAYGVIAVDGVETFLVHVTLPVDQPDLPVDAASVLEVIAGRPVGFEIIDETRWSGRGVVAEHYRDGRVFLAGDAAHLWTPYAGFGMNTGVADAFDLGWKLAAVVQGWAPDSLLDSYELERRPIGERVARAIVAGFKEFSGLFDVSKEMEDDTPEASAARAALGERIRAVDTKQWDCVGLNFGIDYAGSTVLWPDGTSAPEFAIGTYVPTTTPGCRLPHHWLSDGRSLYDALDAGFTLVVIGEAPGDPANLVDAAARRGIPLGVVHLDEPGAADLMQAPLVLVRPDQVVAWRGTSLPDVDALWDRVTGVAVLPAG